jgi:hypothetical protein
MKPLQHARITAHRYGGEWQDWIAIHDWIDRSKAIFPSRQHRMFLHSDFGEWLTVKIHGEPIRAKDGTVISTCDLFYDHQVEDLGRVITLAEWLHGVDADVHQIHDLSGREGAKMLREFMFKGGEEQMSDRPSQKRRSGSQICSST